MPFVKFKKIIDQFPHLKAIELTGLGEPLMNKDFVRMLKYLKSKAIWVDFASNFTLITPRIARELIMVPVDRISVSLDTASRERYEFIRAGADFDRVVGNIKDFIRIKNELKGALPDLSIRATVSTMNVSEMPKLVGLADSLGIKAVHLDQVKTFKETLDLSVDIKEHRRILEEALREAKKMNVTISTSFFTEKKPINKCNAAWGSAYVTYDGYVFPCCISIVQVDDREERIKHSFGNLFEADAQDIWTSERARRFRSIIKKGYAPSLCTECQFFEGKQPKTSF